MAKVLTAKGAKQVNKVPSGKEGILVTIFVTVNAGKNYLPGTCNGVSPQAL